MHLHLEKLVIENYKAFDQRQEIRFQPDITFVIGTNASGKTSLVEILGFLSALARGFGEQHLQRCFAPLSEEGFLGCLSWRDEQRPMVFEIHARSDEGALFYRLSLKYNQRTEGPQVTEEELRAEEGIAAVLKSQDRAWKFSGLRQPYSGDLAAPLILSQRGEWILKDHVEQHWKLKPLLSFLQWVQCWFVLRPNVLEAGRRVETKDVAKHRELAEDGGNFVPVLFNWKNNPVTTHSPMLAGEWPLKHVRALRGGKVVPLPASLSEALQKKRIHLLTAWMLDMVDEPAE